MTTDQPTTSDLESVELTRAVFGDMRVERRPSVFVRSENIESVEESLEVPSLLTDIEQQQPVRVLHVDDNGEITEVTATFLERINENFEVVTEQTVVEALDRLRSEEIDCVVSDYQMPNTDGLEFLEIVREQYSDLPFILYTGQGSEEIASEAIAAGVTDYVQKRGGTDQYEVLANRIENAVESYRTQQQFWDALSWYQRLVEQDIAGVFVVQNGEFVYVNEKLADVFGYDQTDLIGESPERLAVGDERERIEATLIQQESDSDTFRFGFTGKHRDGSDVSVEVHGGPVEYDGDAAILGILQEESAEL